MEKTFIPLLFAGDINVCSVARAFHEQYGMKVSAYGKYPTGPCMSSKIIDYVANEKADEQDTFLKLVTDFAAVHKSKTVLLVGCGDSYVQLMSQNKDNFPNNVIAPYIPIDLMNDLIHKEKFYEMCERVGIDYPTTYVHKKELGLTVQAPFEGRYVVKPSNGIEYWRHAFETQQKVYIADTWDQVLSILNDIYESGYEDSIIIQNFIPGDDSYMWVLTNYSDKHGKVKMTCLGHVLLEEHTPHGSGNHAVIITEPNEELEQKFTKLLEDLNYVGFSNFDIKYDSRDGKYKVFEINTRQGRSNYYVTGAGANVAKYLVDDYILDKPLTYQSVNNENLWMVVPPKVAFDYVKPEKYKLLMKKLIAQGKVVNPLLYKADNGFIRKLRIYKNIHRHYANYKKYVGK